MDVVNKLYGSAFVFIYAFVFTFENPYSIFSLHFSLKELYIISNWIISIVGAVRHQRDEDPGLQPQRDAEDLRAGGQPARQRQVQPQGRGGDPQAHASTCPPARRGGTPRPGPEIPGGQLISIFFLYVHCTVYSPSFLNKSQILT